MKGYYLFAPVEKGCAGPDAGVERKVRSQHKALNSLVDCELVILPVIEYSGTLTEKIIRRLPLTAAWRKWKYQGEFDDADFLYIRQVYHDASFVRYLKAIKKRNPGIKIIYEIPTYPYDAESKITYANAIFTLKERTGRKHAAKYIDRIVTFYDHKEIWGVPCIYLMNGFDFSAVSIPRREKSDTVNIVSVSVTAFWHGYDRFIEGLHKYYANGGKENIVYHLVGNIMGSHKKMVAGYGLEDHVIFYGRKTGEELKEIYAKCLIGIDVLGGHRKDYPVSSSLKSREYSAYGLPLITSSPVDFMPKDYKYQLIVPYDDSPVDMNEVLRFYHEIYDEGDINETAAEIRNFAVEKCDMPVAMQPVVDWLKSSVGR